MRATRRLVFILTVFGTLSLTSSIFGQIQPVDLHAKLSLADNKSNYRSGEPIKLVIEFTADRDGYQVDTIPDGWQPSSDVISVSPASGVTDWLDEFMGGLRYGRDVISLQKLSNTPTRVELLLNDSLRFDSPGKYSVQVTTRRVSPVSSSSNEFRLPIFLTTNSVNFEVQPMTENDEEKEVKRLSDLLDAAHGWQAEEKLTQVLSYLSGEASTREKVKRFLNSEGRSGNYTQHITFGLFIAQNRPLVLQLLEVAMRDPRRPVVPSLLTTVAKLRMLRDYTGATITARITTGMLSPTGDPRLLQIQRTYIVELAAGLSKRAGKSQTTTAMTILMALPRDTASTDSVLAEVCRLLIQQFDTLHPFDREYLLRMHWNRLRDPSLMPSLEKMLGYGGMSSKNLHDIALKCLMEMSPEKARPYVIAEIRDEKSLVDYDILQSLPDASVPEVDTVLVEQIRTLASSKTSFDQMYLKQKASLAARYASDKIYADMMEIYRTTGLQLPLESRACLLAYLAKHNEPEALPLIEQVLNDLVVGQDFNFLPELTRLYYSDAIDSILRKRLEGDEPQAAGTAAYLISLHGSASDEKILEARLEQWRKQWRDRAAEADGNLQGTVERELITALGHGKSWKLSPEKLNELQQSCITKLCKQNFPFPLP